VKTGGGTDSIFKIKIQIHLQLLFAEYVLVNYQSLEVEYQISIHSKYMARKKNSNIEDTLYIVYG